MAGMAGLEPAHIGVKVRCLTAWLHPCVIDRTTRGDGRSPARHFPSFRAVIQEGIPGPCWPLEPLTGIEPALSAWKADALPLNYSGTGAGDVVAVIPCRVKRRYRGGWIGPPLELMVGVEPTTCGLQSRCSTTGLHQRVAPGAVVPSTAPDFSSVPSRQT